MDIESFRRYCLAKREAEETLPFGPDTLVYKVAGKMFALAGLEENECSANLKCDPERALLLRDEYPDHIIPGFHMNKNHWNTVFFERGLPDKILMELIDHSYTLVVTGLPARIRDELNREDG